MVVKSQVAFLVVPPTSGYLPIFNIAPSLLAPESALCSYKLVWGATVALTFLCRSLTRQKNIHVAFVSSFFGHREPLVLVALYVLLCSTQECEEALIRSKMHQKGFKKWLLVQ